MVSGPIRSRWAPRWTRHRSRRSPDAAHRSGQDDQDRDRDQPGRAVSVLWAGGPGERQQDAERHQHGGNCQVEDARPRQDDRSGDDTGQGSGNQHQGEAPAGLFCRQNRYSAPGVATTLYSRLVGVTDGLGVSSTLT